MVNSVQETDSWFVRNFESLEKRLNGSAGSSLHQLRKAAFSKFSELPFPTLKHEEWKYTNVAPIAKTAFKPASESPAEAIRAEVEAKCPSRPGRARLVFVNGHFATELSALDSLPGGVSAHSIAEILKSNGSGPSEDRALLDKHLGRYASFESQAFVALNTAFIMDGGYVRIAKNAVVEEPIEILYVTTADQPGCVTHPRTLVLSESGSQATVIETYLGLGAQEYFTNPVTEVRVEENALLDHYKIQLEGEAAFHVAAIYVEQAGNSHYLSQSFAFGGRLARNDINPVLDGEGIQSTLNGLFVLGKNQHADTHTVIDHAKPHSESHELYKGILGGKSRGVFSGKIIVRKDAQKTNAIQSNRNLLLSRDASIDSKPQLEILADDVKCTHGATVGQMDPDALFYLRSRGIPKEQARRMLVQAFAGEVVDAVRNPDLKAYLEGILVNKLERVG